MNSTAPLITIVLPALALLLAWWMFFRGLRGKKIDHHPWCRRCRFDLHGLPTAQARCPECGADLARRRAIGQGQRRKRPAIVIVSLLLAVPATWFALRNGRDWARDHNWSADMPTWWLAIRVDSTDILAASEAWKEMNCRMLKGKLSRTRVQSLVEHEIDARKTLAHADWLDFAADALSDQWLTDQQRNDLVKSVILPSLAVRPVIAQGEPVALTLHDLNVRQKTAPIVGSVTATCMGLRVGETDLAPPIEQIDVRAASFGFGAPLEAPANLAPGVYTITTNWRVRSQSQLSNDQPVVTEFTVSDSALLRVLHGASVQLFRLPLFEREMRQAVELWNVEELVDSSSGEVSCSMSMGWSEQPPIPFVGDIILRTGSWSRRIGSCSPRNITLDNVILDAPLGVDRIDVILRPNADLARKTLDLTWIWGRDIVFHDVAVRHNM